MSEPPLSRTAHHGRESSAQNIHTAAPDSLAGALTFTAQRFVAIATELDEARAKLAAQDDAISRALSNHWATSITWGGETREACGHCAYMDGVRRLWPCPTVVALTGCEPPDPRPSDQRDTPLVEFDAAAWRASW